MAVVLEAKGLEKRFLGGRNWRGLPKSALHAVNDVSFTIDRGQTLGLVGESGAGKSTVGRLVLRLIEPDRGEVLLNGVDLASCGTRELRRLRAKARMIFQDPYSSLDPRMVVESAVGEPLAVHTDLSKSERREKVMELLESVGMREEHLDRYSYEFSGGQLQRLAIARAITTNPDLIVCDEPVAALDMSIRAQVINLLSKLQQERGLAYLFISHDLSLVRLIADRTMVMFSGRIVESAGTEELFVNPKHPYTRALLASLPLPDATRRYARFRDSIQHPPPSTAIVTPEACVYVGRCPLAMDVCREQAPPLAIEGQHSVACHLFAAPEPPAVGSTQPVGGGALPSTADLTGSPTESLAAWRPSED
jgi:oligopeptide transport system ATP-binding protein